MTPSVFSPTLTATSSTSASNSHSNADVDNIDFDINMIGEEPTLPPNFSELFNFDEYEGELSSLSHSPVTISPNHTPSPLPASFDASPYPLSPSYDFLNQPEQMDFSFDYMVDQKIIGGGEGGPATMGYGIVDDIKIKQEPVYDDIRFASASMSPPAAQVQVQIPVQPLPSVVAEPVPNAMISFAGLPADQQMALQQLMANIMNYQKNFGVDMAAAVASPAAAQTTIKPSEVFSASPVNVASTSSSSSSASPSVPVPQVQVTPPTLAAAVEGNQASSHEEEPLNSVEPHEAHTASIAAATSSEVNRSARQASTFSSIGDDLEMKLERLAPLSAIFSAGKGKGGKKGGGMSSVVKMSDEEFDDDDSWRPSPEEYKKLSSKEKRQLRNKLSARAFRTRRKDYIGTLEGHIKDRDSVIDAIRSELTHSRSENQDLRRELNALKASTMAILHPESASKVSQSPAMLTALSMSPSIPSPLAKPAVASTSALPTTPTIKRTQTPTYPINVRKDLPTSGASYDSSRGFWGGSDNNIFGGGSTFCHTLLTPDIVLPPSPVAPLRTLSDLPRVNLNPLLNSSSGGAPADIRSHTLATAGNGRDISSTTFSEWSETNPFSLRSMDSYRMQMWSRLAREAAADKAGLAGDLRPKFFVDSKSPSSVPTTSPTSVEATVSQTPSAASAATLASVASGHITSKLAGAFWSAFQGPSAKLDTDKLAAVVTGNARLQVVSSSSSSFTSSSGSSSSLNEKSPSTGGQTLDEADVLSSALSGLKLQTGVRTGGELRVRENPLGALTGFLKLSSGVPARA